MLSVKPTGVLGTSLWPHKVMLYGGEEHELLGSGARRLEFVGINLEAVEGVLCSSLSGTAQEVKVLIARMPTWP